MRPALSAEMRGILSGQYVHEIKKLDRIWQVLAKPTPAPSCCGALAARERIYAKRPYRPVAAASGPEPLENGRRSIDGATVLRYGVRRRAMDGQLEWQTSPIESESDR